MQQGTRTAWVVTDRSRPGQVETRLSDEVNQYGYTACVGATRAAKRTIARVHKMIVDTAPDWVDLRYVQPGLGGAHRLDVWSCDGRVPLRVEVSMGPVQNGDLAGTDARIEQDVPAAPLAWPAVAFGWSQGDCGGDPFYQRLAASPAATA